MRGLSDYVYAKSGRFEAGVVLVVWALLSCNISQAQTAQQLRSVERFEMTDGKECEVYNYGNISSLHCSGERGQIDLSTPATFSQDGEDSGVLDIAALPKKMKCTGSINCVYTDFGSVDELCEPGLVNPNLCFAFCSRTIEILGQTYNLAPSGHSGKCEWKEEDD